MDVLTLEETMLYCPKCKRTYEEKTQRFCSVDGGRLLPLINDEDAANPRGVFTKILGRTIHAENLDEARPSAPRVSQTIKPKFAAPIENKFAPPAESKMFKSEPAFELDLPDAAPESPKPLEPAISAPEKNIPAAAETPAKPAARLIRPNEIPASQAALGDRSVSPAGRAALTWKTPEVLLGQTVKGRYRIAESLGADETGLVYLANDKLAEDKQVVVRVFMNEQADDLTSKIIAEERVSFSHINHPNIAGMIDSSTLQEGKPFVISEYVDGRTLEEKLAQIEQFNALRAARIVRQVSDALGQAHQSGVLHRNLRPRNIVLTVSEAGTEQIKVTDFAVYNDYDGELKDNLEYRSPEQLDGKMATYASDIYSLAVIAYQMLTGRLPFVTSSKNVALKSQREGLKVKASAVRDDLPAGVDEILEKALNFDPTERYPKARDFGDAFFNALSAAPTFGEEIEARNERKIAPKVEKQISVAPIVAAPVAAPPKKEVAPLVKTDTIKKVESAKTADEMPWEKRSPEPVKVASSRGMLFSVIGIALLLVGLWAIWNYFLHRPATIETASNNASTAANSVPPTDQNANANTIAPPPAPEIETPPGERQVLQPLNTEYFQNTRENLTGDLVKYYRGFSFYYPNNWTRNPTPTNFVDVSKKAANNVPPVEQFIVTYYDSKGTFKADSEKFPALVKDSNKKLAEMIPNYRFVSEGEIVLNGGWKAYEMKFEKTGDAAKEGDLKLWGRRIFMPAMRPGVRGGFVITMLATSLSDNVKSVDDVGFKGDLSTILGTFEPTPGY